MKEILVLIVKIIAIIHNKIMSINDNHGFGLSDKDLHFLVIGAIGMMMIFLIYPVFKRLAQKNHIMTITWIYVFTMIVTLTFAIEIGQKITGTGNMEFADIVYGVVGFIIMFVIFAFIRFIYHFIRGVIEHKHA